MLPLAKKTKENNAAAIPRTFAFIQRSANVRKVAKFRERLPVLNRFEMECTDRDYGQIARAYRSYARCIRCYDEDAIAGRSGRSSAIHDLDLLLGRKPRERARAKGTESQHGHWQRAATKRATTS